MAEHKIKKILITGANSYIGIAFEKWVSEYKDLQHADKYSVDTVDMKDSMWKKKDFSAYDTVFHVAGIAHTKETTENASLFFEINRDLTVEVANKAKYDGVKQFIFLSSMSVYGIESGIISKDTSPNPKSNYGISKLQAEEQIKLIKDDNFKIAIIRPPMVYGKNCKGNYPRLARIALTLPIFPEVNNKRSMIYIDNLSEFVRLLVDDCGSGLFCPQNEEYVNTSEMVKLIAEIHGKKIRMTKVFNPLLSLLCRRNGTVNKVFGDLVYDRKASEYKEKYCVSKLKESMILTEA